MNTMRSYFDRYKAITKDGKVRYLGYTQELTYDGISYQQSKFGGKYAYFEACYLDDQDDRLPPENLIRGMYPSDITKIWSGENTYDAKNLARMFSLCNIPEETVVGMIVTSEYEGRWGFEHSIETFVIPRPRRED